MAGPLRKQYLGAVRIYGDIIEGLEIKGKVTGQSVLGGEGFIEWIKEEFIEGKKDRERPALRQLHGYRAKEEIVDAIEKETGIGLKEIRGERGQIRQIAMDMLYRIGGLRGVEIGELLGVDYSTVSQDRKRLRGKVNKDRKLKWVKAVKAPKFRACKGLRDIELAGLMHDVGKIGTFETILDKPDRLTDEEAALMRQHPVKGAEILSHIRQLKDVIPAIKHHHEFYDGTGYPDGLKGKEIPLMARILAVADTFDSMTAERPYRKTPGVERDGEEFRQFSGTQFDPEVVKVFLRILPGMEKPG